MFVIGLNPPIRQGQTRYPFLVFQFERDDEIEFDLNLDQGSLEKYDGKLQKSYDGPVYEVVSEVFSGLVSRKIINTSTFRSSQGQNSIKCSQKANEVLLFPLEKSFLALPKPTIQILHSEIAAVTFSRVSGSMSSNLRMFEMKISTTSGDVLFSSIPK